MIIVVDKWLNISVIYVVNSDFYDLLGLNFFKQRSKLKCQEYNKKLKLLSNNHLVKCDFFSNLLKWIYTLLFPSDYNILSFFY